MLANKRKLLWNYFISYMVVFIIIFMIFLAIVYTNTYKLADVNSKNYYENMLRGVKDYYESIIKDIDMVSYRISNSRWIKDLYFSEVLKDREIDSIKLYDIIEELKYMSYTSALFKGIYMNLENDDVIYSSEGLFKNGYIDMSPGKNSKYGTIYGDLCYFNSINNQNSNVKYRIFIKLNSTDILNNISKIIGDDNIAFTLYNSDSIVLNYNINKYTESNADEFQRLELISKKAGNLTYTLFVPKRIYNKEVEYIKSYFVIFVLICFLLAVMMAYFFSMKNYNPVVKIINIFGKSEERIGCKKNELEFIKDKIENILSEEEVLKNRIENYKPFIQNSILSYLLSEGKYNNKIIGDLSEYGIDLLYKYICVLIADISITKQDKKYGVPADQKKCIALISSLIDDFKNKANSLNIWYCEIDEGTKICMLISFNKEEDIGHLIDYIGNEVENRIAGDREIAVTYGLSKFIDNKENVGVCYSQALKALEYKTVFGKGYAIHFKDVEGYNSFDYSFDLKDKIDLINNVKNGNYENIKKYLKKLYQINIFNRKLNIFAYKCLFYDIVATVIKSIEQLNLDKQIINYNDINSLDTFLDLYEYILLLYENICEAINEKLSRECSEKTEKIMYYINNMYFDSNISQNRIAEKFGVSLSYISMVVKKKTGLNYTEYINSKRIEKAMSIINSSETNMNEVCKRIGYNSILTFRRNFKRLTGSLPSEFAQVK